MASSFLPFLFQIFLLFIPVHAQSISTDTPVPPLQWLNLTGVLQGSDKPPPLKDAAIGYDQTSSSIIIFGGESQGGIPQSQTYLLNLDTLTWSRPSPPNNLNQSPPPRSAALYGNDIAASNRQGFIVIGGKGPDGPLSDVWEYSYTSQFWSQVQLSPGGPSARWGAAGGKDSRVEATPDPIVPGPNNTFFLAGGYSGNKGESLSDLWQLHLSGTLSSNLPNSVQGSWEEVHIGNFPSAVYSANTVVSSTVVTSGGCNTSSVTDSSCVTQNSYIVDPSSPVTGNICPAPRLGATMIPNMNGASTRFGSQVFLLLGTVNTTLWSDDNGSQRGEVAIFDINTNVWTRVLPSGDPSSGKETFPTPREGSVAVSASSPLVGGQSSLYSDTLVFGGRDGSGNYLSEVWLLRAFSGSITPANPRWAGFGNGQLQSGVKSSGTGVTAQFLNSCATQLNPSSPKPTNTGSGSPTSPPPPGDASSGSVYDTAITHKVLAPLSLALFLPAFLLFRLYSPPFNSHEQSPQYIAVVYFSGLLILVSYGLGLAGLATSFTSLSFNPAASTSISRRSTPSNTILQTGHGRAGLAFFVGLYGVVPLLYLLATIFKPSLQPNQVPSEIEKEDDRERITSASIDTAEKLRTRTARSASQSLHTTSRPSSPRHRTHSWGPSSFWRPSHERRISSDSDSVSSAPVQRMFEVTNRPNRVRNPSTGMLGAPLSGEHRGISSRSLGEIDWLQRRRSLGAVGELDYALTQTLRARDSPSTPATIDAMLAHAPASADLRPELPNSFQIFIRSFLHICLLGLCVIALIALWTRAPKATFIVFLIWLVLFYSILVVQAWYELPKTSVLAVMVTRLRTEPRKAAPQQIYAPSTTPTFDQYPFPTHDGPYVNDPPFRVAQDDVGPRTTENDDDGDEDEDEDARQRRIESEMGRREIAIVTTQLKRKLWVTNPS